MTAPVTTAQLVQLADYNLLTAKQRQTDKMEALWLGLQSVVLLESALNKSDDYQISIASPRARLPQPTKESIHTKLLNARNELHNFLKSVITQQVPWGIETPATTTLVSDWLVNMLDYFRDKFSNRDSTELRTLHEDEVGALEQYNSYKMSKNFKMRRSTEPCLVRAEREQKSPSSGGSIREKVSYQRMMMKFTTPTAAKYGVNVLDPYSQKAIQDYRNANVSQLPSFEYGGSTPALTEGAPSIRRRSLNVISERRASRPTTLNLTSNNNNNNNTNSSISRRISAVVSDLKSKAERLRRRNSVTSPVVPWQTAIKQHKSMLSELLDDFNPDHSEPQDQNLNYEYPPYSSLSQTSLSHSTLDLSPENFMTSLSQNYGIRRYGSIDSLHFSYQTTTKTVTTQYFENGIETCSSTRSERLDSNGNRHEIYRRGSILDNDVKVTYSRSGSLTPDSAWTPKLQRRSYSLHSFEPVSPLTDICTTVWDERSPDNDYQSPDLTGESVSISEDDILHTLSESVLEMANRNFDEHKYEQAQDLYEQALSIVNRMYKYSGKFEPSIIPILKKCGLIRKYRGDSLGALGIFEQCIEVIEKRENGHCSLEYRVLIIELWYEMGNALIIEGRHSETIGHSIISIMRDRETADFLDAPRSVASDTDPEDSFTTYSSKGQSYPVGAFEALSCYQKAYCKIENLKPEMEVDDDLNEVSAKVLLKIGDCSVLIGDLEVGTNFYESALDCFKSTGTPYSLSDNAHVLVMIGFLQYINGRYSKASVMLQCATIMFHRMESTGERYEKSEFAIVKSLICFTNYETETYAKAVSMGLQARRIYEDMLGEDLQGANKSYTWLVSQTLFIVAKSYYSMNMYPKAIQLLEEITAIFGPQSHLETILRVRIYELIGLCHEATEQPQLAMSMYSKALDVYRGQTESGFTSSALEHTLLSRTAGLHVSMQQYDEAAMCLDPSFTTRDVEEDIRSDMVTLLHHLGETHTLASHVQRAIDCYTECVDVYLEIHNELGPDVVKTLGKLANMHHVKASQSQQTDKDSLFEAEKFYRQAMDIDFSPMLALRYANFLFHQSSYLESIYILQQLLEKDLEVDDVTFAGVEQILVPVLLQSECDEEELVIPGKTLVHYLLVLSFTAIGEMRSAEYYLLDMIYEADENDTLVLSVIGYSLLELSLYTEAYCWFDFADRISSYPASTLAWENKLFCVALEIFRVLRRGLLFLYEYRYGVGTFPSDYAFVP